ncbi:MAG: PAS domain-containing protein [Desulfobacterota bacterium]|jgi:PAS domain S-box-containing protein|nr:PAS domain-containing protein [Thermodesulfobacteriota bacterium]
MELVGFSEFIHALPVAVFRERPDGRIVYCNKALAEMFGFESSAELLEHPMTAFYRSAEDRDLLLNTVMKTGRVVDAPLFLKRRDGRPMWCRLTAKASVDEDGTLVHLDGVLRDAAKEIEKRGTRPTLENMANVLSDFVVLLGPDGEIADINKAGSELLGFKPEDLIGRSIADFVIPRLRDLFSTFLSIVIKTGREEGILTIMDRNGDERHLEFHAFMDERQGSPATGHIHLVARNVTDRIRYHKEQLSKEKFIGVLEMAGGVAHKLNQPLMIMRNAVTEVLSGMSSKDPNYERLLKIHQQVERISEIAKKIGNIKKYEPMDYVAGIKIVDIDKTS